MAVAEETLRAIRRGEVDAVVVAGKVGLQVFTLQGADHAYRVLIESMHEGALTLSAGHLILYANECFARMVKHPLGQVIGGSFRRFLSPADRLILRGLLQHSIPSGAKVQMQLKARDGSHLPVQISLRPLAKAGANRATLGLVVTDMTEARRTEGLLRSLAHRVVQVQENDSARVALRLHDHISQLLCAVLFRSHALVNKLSSQDGPAKKEALILNRLLSRAAGEVERISCNLRPSMLNNLSLADVLGVTSEEFTARTGIAVRLTCGDLASRLPANSELALYRILQHALKNVEQHAHASEVVADLRQQGAFVRLAIRDDGIGFDSAFRSRGLRDKRGLGLVGLRERATYVGGHVIIRSSRQVGTEIEVWLPLRRRRALAAKTHKPPLPA